MAIELETLSQKPRWMASIVNPHIPIPCREYEAQKKPRDPVSKGRKIPQEHVLTGLKVPTYSMLNIPWNQFHHLLTLSI